MENQMLEAIPATEYENVAGLVNGVVSNEELLGAIRANPNLIRRVPAAQAVKGMAKGAPSITEVQGSRGQFEARFGQVSKTIREQLLKGNLQLVDSELAVVKLMVAGTTQMFIDSDVKVTGISMINAAKLEKGEIFLLSGIQLLEAVAAGDSVANIVASDFGLISAATRNGKFEFKANGKTLIPWASMEVFAQQLRDRAVVTSSGAFTGTSSVVGAYGTYYGDMRVRPGYFKLANPKLIETQQAIELNIEVNPNASVTAHTYLKAILVGTRVAKH